MNNLVSSICNLNTRKFGDVGEILMSKIIKGLEKSDDLSYDKKLGDQKGEVKVSRAFTKANPITEENICEVLMQDNSVRLIEDKNKLEQRWDCNIQQVKTGCFDILWYGVFFKDMIYVFEIPSETISKDPNIQYSDKQHRGNTGEGQFHLKNSNIQHHIDNYLYAKMDYEKLSNTSLKIDYYDTMLVYIESILKVIQNRTFQIKNAIEFMRFNSGLG